MALESFGASNRIADTDPLKQVKDFLDARQVFTKHFPVDKEAYSYNVMWNSFKKMTMSFSETERDALFNNTASKVYRL